MTSEAPSRGVTHTFHTTKSGLKVQLDLVNGDKDGPVLISYHGGGIVHGSRTDMYTPGPMSDAWPGALILADYRFLVPSSGFDILEDVKAIFEYLPKILKPSQLDKIFVAGFSGGGYVARLAAIVAAEEALASSPHYTVRGIISYAGMGGDFLLDHWLTRRKTDLEDKRALKEIQEDSAKIVAKLKDAGEISDASFDPTVSTHNPERNAVWVNFHAYGILPDRISGKDGLSDTLRAEHRNKRDDLIPNDLRVTFPQLAFTNPPSKLPAFLLLHGDADPVIPYEESIHTYKSLKAAGVDVVLHTVPGGDHGLQVANGTGKEEEEAIKVAMEWIQARC